MTSGVVGGDSRGHSACLYGKADNILFNIHPWAALQYSLTGGMPRNNLDCMDCIYEAVNCGYKSEGEGLALDELVRENIAAEE